MIKLFWIVLLFAGCTSVMVPPEFVYKEVQGGDFTIATWQKITNPQAVYKIYIEGDGYAFDARGKATNNPTPRGSLMRELAFGDNHPNVIYLARPCQYIKDKSCLQKYWTTARFSPQIIASEAAVIRQIIGSQKVILIGFSGGAQVAGLVSVTNSKLRVKKIVTLAGNLNHQTWTRYHRLPPLEESMSLQDYREQYIKIPQINYVGSDDEIVPPDLTYEFVGIDDLIVVIDGVSHDRGWQSVYQKIWQEE